MNREFTYLNEIAWWLMGKTDFTHSEYNLSGSRYSGKTFSISETIANLIVISIKYNKKIAIYGFRKLNKDINDLVKEIYGALTNIGLIEKEHFLLKYPNKQADFRFISTSSFIRVMGIYNNANERVPLKGLSREEVKSFDLAIDWEEEANELTQQEFQAITFAIGSCIKRIKIRTCNPDNIYQYHISYMNNIVPFDLRLMQEENEQIKSVYNNQNFKLFHYSNWKLNQNNLTMDIQNNLEELKVLDPIKANSWYWGVPSVLQGAIFARYLEKTKTVLDFSVTKIVGGLDIGTATSNTGHPTAGSLWFIGENQNSRRAHKVSEFYHSNADMHFQDTYQLANSIINYYYKEAQHYHAMILQGFTCYVDYGNGGQAFIDILNQEKRNRNLQWLQFQAVNKSIFYLRDRIDFITAGILKNILSYDWKRCFHTKRQYSLIQWINKNNTANNNNELKMLDLHDDTFDSDCYALMYDMPWLMNNIKNELLLSNKNLGNKKSKYYNQNN